MRDWELGICFFTERTAWTRVFRPTNPMGLDSDATGRGCDFIGVPPGRGAVWARDDDDLGGNVGSVHGSDATRTATGAVGPSDYFRA